MPALPQTFWERSMFTRPRDREVVCHASAWDIDDKDDVRIKMCMRPVEEDLFTIYHELGHVYYYIWYKDQPMLFQDGAHDGFHEAIGDAVNLSVTNLFDLGFPDAVGTALAEVGLPGDPSGPAEDRHADTRAAEPPVRAADTTTSATISIVSPSVLVISFKASRMNPVEALRRG